MASKALMSLYRRCVRGTRKLPARYLRLFYGIKFRDDIQRVSNTKDDEFLLRSKLRRVVGEAVKLEAALKGDEKAFSHVLDVAYGRKGRLRWEIMTPLLSDPKVTLPEPIIRGVLKSRPPVYSPELEALLTSPISRPTKVIQANALDFPPNLPKHARPSSEFFGALGPFSKRREVNARWRFFTEEWRKTLPPLELMVESPQGVSSNPTELCRIGARSIGFQGTQLMEDIQTIIGDNHGTVPLTRKERCVLGVGAPQEIIPARHPSRFVRRRYQQLLSRIPVLTCSEDLRFTVSRGRHALYHDRHNGHARIADADAANEAWLETGRADSKKNPTTPRRKANK